MHMYREYIYILYTLKEYSISPLLLNLFLPSLENAWARVENTERPCQLLASLCTVFITYNLKLITIHKKIVNKVGGEGGVQCPCHYPGERSFACAWNTWKWGTCLFIPCISWNRRLPHLSTDGSPAWRVIFGGVEGLRYMVHTEGAGLLVGQIRGIVWFLRKWTFILSSIENVQKNSW